MTDERVSLFPLNTVLFPGGPLPLRIFETRYLDMVSRCMKEQKAFGVLLMTNGAETGDAQMVSIGTLARIIDWYQGSDGILGITAVGTERFMLQSMERREDGLYLGEVEILEPEPRQPIPEEFGQLSALLEVIINDLGKLYEGLDKDFDDATWVGHRFAEVLPITLEQKQHCLELDGAISRLEYLRPLLRSIRQEMSQ